MAATLDDIWDEDVPGTANNEPLFLEEPEEPTPQNNATITEPNASHLLDNLDDLFNLSDDDLSLPPELDQQALLKEANARHAKHALAASMVDNDLSTTFFSAFFGFIRGRKYEHHNNIQGG